MLRQLVLGRKITSLRDQLSALLKRDADFSARSEALKKRNDELEAAINEVTDQTAQEDKDAIDAAVAEHEANEKALTDEKSENDGKKQQLTDEIKKLEDELAELNARGKDQPSPAPAADGDQGEKRKEKHHMTNRSLFRDGLNKIISRDDVKEFLVRVRGMKGETRAVTGTELLIPTVMLDMLRDNLHRYSKLITKVRLRPVGGKTRTRITGAIPEGVWMEITGTLNELAFKFSQVETDAYMVGGYIPIHNTALEDSDINLASEIMDNLSQAVGIALDKAILYGTGTKMPIGVMTRLAQTAKPSTWGADAPDWTDLHATNLLKINPASYTAAADFFAALLLYMFVAKPNFSDGVKTWCMNSKTWATLLSKTITFNAAGALVASQQNTMPIIGGDVVILEFMPDYDIVGGYMSLYLLPEREGVSLESSEHVRFLQNQTLYKGYARYDGMPVIGEAFVAVNIANADPTTTRTFATDVANKVATPTAMPVAGSFATTVTVFLACETPGADIHYTTDGSAPTTAKPKYSTTGPITLSATATVKAIAVKSKMENSDMLTATYTKT